MTFGLEHYLVLSAVLFVIGLYGRWPGATP
jgi:NADH:ubiquinone oxidoreductase subunit K